MMNIERFTKKAREALHNATELATERHHSQTVQPDTLD